ncbi:hypothetical protein ABIB85_007928 [Bradyrhizobium sp. JR1.5]|uniref:hypothetical protein n=1 Tax=unclassified Bradyrhizobium TaxID=2631580 RepID=UPI00339882F2
MRGLRQVGWAEIWEFATITTKLRGIDRRELTIVLSGAKRRWDKRSFRFSSSERLFDSLDGREFRSARDAERISCAFFSEGFVAGASVAANVAHRDPAGIVYASFLTMRLVGSRH